MRKELTYFLGCTNYLVMENGLQEKLSELIKDKSLQKKLIKLFKKELSDKEEQLTRSYQNEQYLRLILDLDPSFIFARDKDGRFTLANQAIANSYGKKAEDMIGKTDADFNLGRSEFEEILKDDQEVLNSWEEKVIPEKRIVDIHGNKRWLRIIKRPLISKSGEVEQVLAVAVDITEYKNSKDLLSKKELRYRTLLMGLAEIVWVTNEFGQMIEEQDMWMNYTGQTKDEIWDYGWLNAVHVDDRERTKAAWMRAVEINTHFEAKCRIRSKDYTYNYFKLWAEPVMGEDGIAQEWVGAGAFDKTFRSNH